MVSNCVCAPSPERNDWMVSDYNEITQNIILKMIETGKISLKSKNNDNPNEMDVNTFNALEICRMYKTVYKTVINPND